MRDFSDNETLVGYLLNEMPEGERGAFEERYFTDDELYRKLSATEAALINSYVRGKLPRAGREKFRRQYMTSPYRVRKVEAAAQALGRGGLLGYLKRSLPPFGASWRVSFASLLVLAVLSGLCGVMFFERRQIQRQLEQTQLLAQQKEAEHLAQLSAQTEQVNAGRASSEQLQAELQKERDRHRQSEEEAARLLKARQREGTSARQATASGRGTAALIATYTFPRELVRTLDFNGPSQEPLVLRRGVVWVRLKMYIESNSYNEYVVSLQRVGGSEVWKQVVPKARLSRKGEWVSFDIPAALFNGKHFILKVSGPPTNGDSEVLAFHQLNVDTPSAAGLNKVGDRQYFVKQRQSLPRQP